MGKLQGYRKLINSTTLRMWRKDEEELELAWDGKDVLLYLNGKYLRKITETPTVQIEVWDPEKSYLAGDNFVSYKSPDYQLLEDDNPFKEEYIYRCVENASAGHSPESHPDKWLRQGKVGEVGQNTIFLSDVSGLEEALNERIKYTDLSDEFKVGPDNGVSLNIDYITLNNYSPSEDIQPASDEIQINNTIWKTSNETFDDGHDGIYVPMNPDGSLVEEEEYGLLYSESAVQAVLAANPGYRLPTENDFLDSFGTSLALKDSVAGREDLWSPELDPGYYYYENQDILIPWEENSFNDLGLSIVPSGAYQISNSSYKVYARKHISGYWMDFGYFYTSVTVGSGYESAYPTVGYTDADELFQVPLDDLALSIRLVKDI